MIFYSFYDITLYQFGTTSRPWHNIMYPTLAWARYCWLLLTCLSACLSNTFAEHLTEKSRATTTCLPICLQRFANYLLPACLPACLQSKTIHLPTCLSAYQTTYLTAYPSYLLDGIPRPTCNSHGYPTIHQEYGLGPRRRIYIALRKDSYCYDSWLETHEEGFRCWPMRHGNSINGREPATMACV